MEDRREQVSANAIAVRPPSTADIPALLAFAREYYGPHSHQGNPRRLDWLYTENPYTQGLSQDVTIAVAEDRVIGCHWKTRLPWRIFGGRLTFPSPHDLALLPEFRSGKEPSASTPGMLLAMFGIKGEQHAALLGLSPASESLYSRLNCPRVPLLRTRKILSGPRTLLGVALQSLHLARDTARPQGIQFAWNEREYAVQVHSHPDLSTIHRALSIPCEGECGPDWDAASFRWRFFHPLGPQHFLVLLNQLGEITARAVFSYGKRRGALIARLVDAAVSSPDLYPPLLKTTENAMRRLGIAIATAATTVQPANAYLTGHGWRIQTGVEARFFSRRGQSPASFHLWGGAYDYGFDGM